MKQKLISRVNSNHKMNLNWIPYREVNQNFNRKSNSKVNQKPHRNVNPKENQIFAFKIELKTE